MLSALPGRKSAVQKVLISGIAGGPDSFNAIASGLATSPLKNHIIPLFPFVAALKDAGCDPLPVILYVKDACGGAIKSDLVGLGEGMDVHDRFSCYRFLSASTFATTRSGGIPASTVQWPSLAQGLSFGKWCPAWA